MLLPCLNEYANWSIVIPVNGLFFLVKYVPFPAHITNIKSSLSSINPPIASISSNNTLPGLASIKKGFLGIPGIQLEDHHLFRNSFYGIFC